jgi:hypothetical protein
MLPLSVPMRRSARATPCPWRHLIGLTSAHGQRDLSLLAQQVREATANTLDAGKGVHHLFAAVAKQQAEDGA